jgi:hypothetical protein
MPRPYYPAGKNYGTHSIGERVGPRTVLDILEKGKSYPGKNYGTHSVGEWVGPRTVLDILEKGKSYPCQYLMVRSSSQQSSHYQN